MLTFSVRGIVAILLLSLSAAAPWAAPDDTFVIEDIRLEGLQRVSPEAVFAEMPVVIGGRFEASMAADLIRDLFATGNFDDVEVGRDGKILVVNLRERPLISSLEIDGNKVIKEADLRKGLKNSGLSVGRVLKRATLEGVRTSLQRQYASHGRYDADVKVELTEQPRNRVEIKLQIDEGNQAKIRALDIIGNEDFSTDELLSVFESKKAAAGWAFWSRRGRYSRETLGSDFERLESFYRDRGYLRFTIEQARVSIDPDKRSVFINIIVSENDRYTISDLNFIGEKILSDDELRAAAALKTGEFYSELKIKNAEQRIERLLNNLGYLNAEVRFQSREDEQTKTLDLRCFIDPGRRTYVRRIEFTGNTNTVDEVLRREMRQLESAPASRDAIEASRVRLERLGFFKEAKVETVPVAGSPDEVDVLFEVEEEFAGTIVFSLGYNRTYGTLYSLELERRNLFGTGRTLDLSMRRNQAVDTFNLLLIDPYFTDEGISRSISLYHRDIDLSEVNITSYVTRSYGGGLTFGYPIGDTARLNFGFGYDHTRVDTGVGVVQEIRGSPRPYLDADVGDQRDTFVDAGGDLGCRSAGQRFVQADSDPTSETGTYECLTDDYLLSTPQGFLDVHGDEFESWKLNFSWAQFKLNRGQLATRGYAQNLGFTMTLPGSDLEYFKVSHRFEYFRPLNDTFTLRFHSRLGYIGTYGDTERAPFYEHFFAGGLNSVRGYDTNTLGPHATLPQQYRIASNPDDIADYIYKHEGGRLITEDVFLSAETDPFGGNILTTFSFELLFPLPFIPDQRSVRSGFFLDVGNVFDSECGPNQPRCSNFDVGELRAGIGFGLVWLTGFGPLNFSFAVPLGDDDDDETQGFEFSIGRGFGL